MSSKLTHLLLAVYCLTLSACSLKLNDTVTKPVSSPSTGAGCLSQAGDVFDRYHKGSLSEAEHEAFFGCANKALTTFSEHADGKNKSSFAPEELASFLTTYFLKGTTIQPKLLEEVMALKVAVIGGENSQISRQELNLIIRQIEKLRVITGNLRPFMPLTPSTFLSRNIEPEAFDHAMNLFVQGVADFGNSMGGGNYHFDHMAKLIQELQLFLYRGQPPGDNWTFTFLKYAEALRPAKAILISAPRDEILASDWPLIYSLGPRYLSLYLRSQLFFTSTNSYLSGQGLNNLYSLYSDFIDLYQTTINQHVGQKITAQEIDDLIQTFASKNLLPCGPETAHSFIRVIFGKLLGTDSDSRTFNLTADSLSRFQENFLFGIEGLYAIEYLFRSLNSGNSFLPGDLSAEQVSAIPSSTLIENTRFKNQISQEAVESIKLSAREIKTIFSSDQGHIQIPVGTISSRISHYHLARVHILRSLNRVVFHAYGAPSATELTQAQLNSLLDEIFPMMHELKLVSGDMRESIGKRLFEASLFLYSSDGDRGLNMNEAIEMEAVVFSTLSIAPRMFQAIKAKCPSDEASANTISANCFQGEFLASVSSYWSHIPGLANFLADKSLRQRGEIFSSIERVIRKGRQANEDFTLADTQAFVQLPYYVEMLFSRFDANHDGLFDNNEAQLAYRVFEPFIAQKAGEKGYHNPSDHRAIFNYLLANRALPMDNRWSYAIRRYILGDQTFRLDRGQVVEIFEKLLSL